MPTAEVYRQRSKCRWCYWILYLSILTAGVNAAVPVAPYFNGTFPLQAPGTTGWTTRNAFPNLTFTDPLWMSEIPGAEEMLVLVRGGQIWRFTSDPAVTPAQRTQVLDISDRIQLAPELGLLRMAFHPRFGQGGSGSNDVFLCYSHRPPGTTASIDTNLWRISRFQWQPATGTIDPASEQVLIQQYDPNGWHNGGAMAFDNNGYLLITCGDGGGSNGQYGLVQQLTGGFFGGVLRIDVDNDPTRSHPIRRQPAASSKPSGYPANFSQGYGIPNDNPWLDPAGSKLEEFQAIGLRSPHTAHYDPVSGELWIADVGQSQREEINRLSPGANFGWPFREGTLTGPQFKPNPLIGTETLPFHSYDRQVGGCIIGGLRYRGARWASRLGGKVIFGDNVKGSLYAATPGSDGNPTATELLFEGFGTAVYSGISGLATDAAGEIYVLQLNGAGQGGATIRIMELEEQFPEPPALLSQTGLFTDTAALVASPALVPYEVASPLWSDGALKRRWMAIPNDGVRSSSLERIAYSQTGNWSFPHGTILVKHFEMPVDERDPTRVKRLETRVMVCTPYGKYGVTYRWNPAGTDATLISPGQDETFSVTAANGSTASRTWSYPSRANCMECHTAAGGQALGLRTHQVKRPVTHPLTGATVDQLAYFNDEKILLASATEIAQAVPAAEIDDETFPIEHRVRSWLDSNCAHCHQPGAAVSYFDARLQTPLRNQGLINGLIAGQFNLPGGRYVKPGDSALSAIHVRAASVAPGVAMPPLGKHVVDEEGVALLAEYIEGLTEEEFASVAPGNWPARCSVTGVAHSVAAEFPVTIVFDTAVTGFTGGDIAVTGGSVKSLQGSGYHYTAMIKATAPQVGVTVRGNSVVAGTYSNSASDTWTVNSDLAYPPVPVFSGMPESIYGPFEMRVSFDQAFTGLEGADFILANGTLEWLILEGTSCRLIVAPSGTADVSVQLADGAVTGTHGLPMAKGISATLGYRVLSMKAEAESFVGAGFVAVQDPAASGGAYIWVPEGVRGAATGIEGSYVISFGMMLPYSGPYKVQAWTRADDAQSNSFHLSGSYGNASIVWRPWTTNQGTGEIGSLQFHAGYARDEGAPLTLYLPGGQAVNLDLAAAEDGTRLDRVELVPVQPFGLWRGASSQPGQGLRANLHFTSGVTGLTPAGLGVVGGRVMAIAGNDKDYTVTLWPSSSKMAVWLKEGAVADEAGTLCKASAPYIAAWPDGDYGEWAAARGLSAVPAEDAVDPDGDGVGQLMEYALGLDPLWADVRSIVPGDVSSRGLPRMELEPFGGGKRLVLVYRCRSDGTPLDFTAEFGGDLDHFTPTSLHGQVSTIDPRWVEVRVNDDAATGSEQMRFGRLRVERAE